MGMYATGEYHQESGVLGMDERIGIYGGQAPSVCAVSGQARQIGAVKHPLGSGFYCVVNPAHDALFDEVAIKALLPTPKRGKHVSINPMDNE
jgi:hypothetical protein